jgi:hypothetical protein
MCAPWTEAGRPRALMTFLATVLVSSCGAGDHEEPDLAIPDGATEGVLRTDGYRLEAVRPGEAGPPVVYSFVAMSDTQPPTTSCEIPGNPDMLAIPQAVLSLKPDFVIDMGDLMDHGGEKGAYDAFKSCYGDILLKVPFFPTMGNHDEDWGMGFTPYTKYLEEQLGKQNQSLVGVLYPRRFPLWYKDDPTKYSTDIDKPTMKNIVPSGFSWKTFYAFKYQNAYFLSFELMLPFFTDTPIPWVEKHLKAARADPTVEHIFVYLHYPLYISSADETDPDVGLYAVRKWYEALFRKYDVTMVLSGHAHMYSHAYVPDDGHATRTKRPPPVYTHDGKAIHYVVAGGSSWTINPLPDEYTDQKSYKYIQARGTGNHVVNVSVEGKKLTVHVISVRGDATTTKTSTLDRFVIE